ncbi:nuclear transport factor 2 family protein [Rhodococcus sp. T7]|uniref:nuclear transport factor 2 family protein n=1 Tax=Rhodococcus sp. T7 TaxID=627444 RepID=UPI0013582834|nr:nuclear transport factor 2 family protein [Rhodococcus sp. T7]KAF0957698.1 Bile acid 7-alpha dehydratase [Rhodococcus sp. T7]KAF0963482.1 Bile acid 7-alpha dehydratase [Rhodococcus sp. T7]
MDDIEQIKQLKARYFRFMDTRDWESYRTVFTEDVLFDVRGGAEATRPGTVYDEPALTGRDAAVELISKSMLGMVSAHQGFLPEIEILSSDEARGTWAMTDVLRAVADAPFRTMRGYGHYHETYRRVGGEWKIATLRLTRLLVDVE